MKNFYKNIFVILICMALMGCSRTMISQDISPNNDSDGLRVAGVADPNTNYLEWKSRYITADGASGFLRVQRPQNANDTVSEGNAYGMLIAAYMNDKATFDGLWNYSKKYFDSKGLMNWNISSSGTILGTGSASDADEDMALALIKADKQWGGYTSAAFNMLTSIMTNDISSGVLKPGDSWGATNVVNPSYLSPAWYRVFRDYTGNSAWNTVISKSYSIINLVKNPVTGLVPDWTTSTGGSASAITWDTHKDDYYYDATRTPLRISIDYLWNQSSDAQQYSNLIANFFQTVGAANIKDGYFLNGAVFGNNHDTAFIGPIACAAAFSNASQTFKDNINTELVNMGFKGVYYSDTLRMLSLLVTSGTFTNPLAGSILPTANLAPIANAGANQTVKPGAFIKLNGAGSYDPDGNVISYQWTQTFGPAVVLSSATTATPTFTTNIIGTYIFNLVVNDGKLNSNVASVTITVKKPGKK